MFSSTACRCLFVTMFALVLSARADRIPLLQAGGKTRTIEVQQLSATKMTPLELLYNSTLAQKKPKTATRIFFIRQDDAALPSRSARGTNFLEWMFSTIGKFVLPNQKKHRTGY